jgi:hypothetical protein
MILFPLFATDDVDTGGNLLPVSTTPVVPVAKFAAGILDTGGNFATVIVDTGGKFTPGGVVDTGGAPSLVNIFASFQKNSK